MTINEKMTLTEISINGIARFVAEGNSDIGHVTIEKGTWIDMGKPVEINIAISDASISHREATVIQDPIQVEHVAVASAEALPHPTVTKEGRRHAVRNTVLAILGGLAYGALLVSPWLVG